MSTIDKKEAVVSSSKHSIKEHHDEITDDNNRETKTMEQIPVDEIHTVNDWEHADLGDEERKQKFLRLMGAKKRKDSNQDEGKKHCRSTIETETINRELEKQFNEGLQSKILHTHHEGLGFHGDESTSSTDHPPHFIHATIPETQSSKPNKSE